MNFNIISEYGKILYKNKLIKPNIMYAQVLYYESGYIGEYYLKLNKQLADEIGHDKYYHLIADYSEYDLDKFVFTDEDWHASKEHIRSLTEFKRISEIWIVGKTGVAIDIFTSSMKKFMDENGLAPIIFAAVSSYDDAIKLAEAINKSIQVSDHRNDILKNFKTIDDYL